MPLARWLSSLEVSLGAPAWLLLLLAAPGLFLIARRSLGDFSRGERAAQAVVRLLVLAGLALALARPALRRDASEIAAVALVDVSDSVSAADLLVSRDLVRRLEDAVARRPFGRGIPARVVRFADSPEEVVSGASGRISDALARFPALTASAAATGRGAGSGSGTDLALAMGLGVGLFDPAGIPRLLVISDGETTSGDALAQAERAAARGVRIYVHTLAGTRDEGDVAIESLTAPDAIRPHAPFDLAIHLLADRAGPARLRLERDGKPNQPDAERTLALTAGANVVSWKTSVEQPGTSVFRARLIGRREAPEPAQGAAPGPAPFGDAHPENDVGVLAIATERDPRVLYIEGDLRADLAFARALQAESIAVDVRGPADLPAGSQLDRYDLVVLSDVARAALGEKKMQLLDAFVRAGGGLLMAGGVASFGSGGYASSSLEGILPVRLDLPEKLDEATLALALVIDKSGSMSGPKMELTKEAARATAEMMPPSDLIAIIVFDSQSTPVVRLQRAANRARILSDISRIQASGGTNILAGLREAVDELLSARARKKHIILLSDGQSGYDGISDLLETAAGAPITVSAVGVGEGADQTLLQMIATRGGGRFYQTRDPSSIPRIFSKETSQIGRSSLVEAPTLVHVRKHAELLRGLSLDTAPPLGGYALTRPRPQADLILASASGDPLLARWQIGLGLVAAWTSDVKTRWSADWIRWPGFGKFWAQVVRTTMRRRAANHFPMRATLDGASVSVVVDAIDADDRFLGGLDGSLEIATASVADLADLAAPAGNNRTVALAETAPGRYEATFPINRHDAGALVLKANLGRAGAPIADASGRLAIPFAPELRPRPAAAAATTGGGSELSTSPAPSPTLAAIAARTGGSELADPSRLLDPGPDRRTTLQPIRTQVLLVTLGIFMIDVLLRRVKPRAIISRLLRSRRKV